MICLLLASSCSIVGSQDDNGTTIDSEECPTTGKQRTIELLTMLPYPNAIPLFNPSWTDGPNILPAILLAEEQINNRTDLLPCHQLKLRHVDGGCDISATTAYSTALGLIDKSRGGGSSGVVGMIGPGCSRSALQTAHVLNQPSIRLIQLHDAGTPLLADRDKYQNSLGILGSTQTYVDLSLALMRKSNWKNIAILFESNRVFFRSTKEAFVASLNSSINVLFTSPVYPTFYPLDGVRTSLARIVFLFTSSSHAMRIMCLAYHAGMVYPAYQWVLISRRLSDFVGENASLSDSITFSYSQQTYTCSFDNLLNVAFEGAFLTNYQLRTFSPGNKNKPVANTTFDQFLELYQERADSANASTTYWAYNVYDAVWAWARVLHRITSNNSEIFDNFQYGSDSLENMILNEFYSPNFAFEGMSGLISFNSSNGFIDRPSNLYQVISGVERYVAYNNGTDIVKLQSLVVVPDLVKEVEFAHVGVIVLFATIQFVLFFVIIALHIPTVIYRKQPIVRASSPNLSHFAFIGMYIVIFGLMIFVFTEVREHPPEVTGPFCQTIWAWCFPLGFTLTIGTVTVRTWRLYRIFTHYLDPGKLISNTALITMIVILVSIDVIIATIWTITSPLRLMRVDHIVRDGPANEIIQDRSCRSDTGWKGIFWLALVASIKVILLGILVVLSLLTRRIPNKTFATSSLRVFSYIFSCVLVLGLFLYYFFVFFSLNPNIDVSILCIVLNSVILLYVVCVFCPPLVPIFRRKLNQARGITSL